jgi:tyrosinase
LEGTSHNLVHNNIGGWMPTAVSPLDPLFFMHHCNIDRIWALWRGLGHPDSTDPLWQDMSFQDNFYNDDGSFYSPKVSDLLVPELLNYTYGLGATVVASAPSMLLSLNEKLTTLRARPTVEAGSGITNFVARNAAAAKATPARPLEISVSVDAGLVRAVARRPPVDSGRELLSFQSAQEVAAAGTRAFGFIRDVSATDSQSTVFRVFIDAPDLTPQTPASDRHYVGAFGLFNHGAHAGHNNPSFAVDLTQPIQRVYGSLAEAPDQIKVQIQPVPSKPGDKVGTATVSSVEVAFVSN